MLPSVGYLILLPHQNLSYGLVIQYPVETINTQDFKIRPMLIKGLQSQLASQESDGCEI